MADDKTNRGNPNRKRINLSQDYEVRDWSRKFGVSEQELRAAVKAVGSDAAAVPLLSGQDVNQLPVVDNDRLVGLLQRDDVLKWLALQQTRLTDQRGCGWRSSTLAASLRGRDQSESSE